MLKRFRFTVLALASLLMSADADEIHWYGMGVVEHTAKVAGGIPLKEGEQVAWSLRFEVEVNDEELPFGKKVAAELSLAAGGRLWTFGDLEVESTGMAVGDWKSRDLVNFAFKRGKEGEHFTGPGTEEIWSSTFRIHGSPEMLSGETGRALSQAFFDWNSEDFRPFIALGYGDETYLWIELLSLESGLGGEKNGLAAGMAEALRFAPAIRIRREPVDGGGQRMMLEYTIDQARYGADSLPVLEMSADLVHWEPLEEESYPFQVTEHEDGVVTRQYEILFGGDLEEVDRRFFRVRSP